MTNEASVRTRRRLLTALAVATLLVVALVAAFPWMLGTAPARRWMLSRADRALAPGGLSFDSIRLSWFGPTRMTNFVLRDASGDRVVVASVATWDRGLYRVLFDRPRYGTLVLAGADLDIERKADGTIDLYETIKPVISSNPKTALNIEFEGGKLRFRGPGLPEPVVADRADLKLMIQPAPGSIFWKLRMRKGPASPDPSTMEIGGLYQRWQVRPSGVPADLTVGLTGHRWPWSLGAGGLVARGELEGGLSLMRQAGYSTLAGGPRIDHLDVSGPRLRGDHLRLDRVAAAWTLIEGAEGWNVRQVSLESPVATVRTRGTLPAPKGEVGRITGTLDLAAIARQLPHALRLREGIALDRGSASITVEAGAGGGGKAWDVEAKVSDLVAREGARGFTLHDPATISARVVRPKDEWTVARLAVKTAFLDVAGRGDPDRGVSWSGTLDLGGLQRQLRDLVDFGAVELAGRGDLSGDYRRAGDDFKAALAADLRGLRLGGLGAGAIRRDAARLDLSLEGPASPSGLPRSWRAARLGLTSGTLSAEVSATARDGTTALTATVGAPVRLSGRDHRAEARLTARADGPGVAVERLRLALVPPEAGAAPIAIEAHGRYDRATGELVLTPSDASNGAIALAPEGLHVAGIGTPGALRADLALVGDLAALGRLAGTPGGLAGAWSGRASVRTTEDGLQIGGTLGVPDLALAVEGGGSRREGPVGVALKGLYRAEDDRIDLAELVLSCRYATLEASGRVVELAGLRKADLSGTLTPDWTVIGDRLAARVEPGARVSGKPRPFRLRGDLGAESTDALLRSLDGEIGIELTGASLYGMRVGPTPIVFRPTGGSLAFDPIDATLNGGRLHLEPSLTLGGPEGSALRLGPESSVSGAEINDEVSHRVLSFVAPVLDRATRVHGRVSVELDEAVFPIVGDRARGTTVQGDVVFHEVEFVAGPLADQILGLLGRSDRPSIKLDEPVALSIADRRVHQSGLALPLGGLTRVELEGWVDFDRNLEMVASLPVTAAMVGNRPMLSDIVEGTRVRIPIRGTLQHPAIDKDALNFAMKDLGKTLLERGVGRGAAELLMRMTRPRDPNAPPPPTAEERRALRLEKRAQRRANRGLGPPPF